MKKRVSGYLVFNVNHNRVRWVRTRPDLGPAEAALHLNLTLEMAEPHIASLAADLTIPAPQVKDPQLTTLSETAARLDQEAGKGH